MLQTKTSFKLWRTICLAALWVAASMPLYAQTLTACKIQLLPPINSNSLGAYIISVGNNPPLSGNLTHNTPLDLGSNCGRLTYRSDTQIYTWAPSWWLYAQYFLVAGGGAGGAINFGGGGGGGGILSGLANIDPTQTYAFTVGAGGDVAVSNFSMGETGGNSTGFGLTAFGGGGGSSGYLIPTNDFTAGGGSGGGAGAGFP